MPFKLTSPKYTVILGNPSDESTWQQLEVQAISRDIVKAEELLGKRKQKATEAQLGAATAAAMCALIRVGKIDANVSYDRFVDQLVDLDMGGEDEEDPTPPAV